MTRQEIDKVLAMIESHEDPEKGNPRMKLIVNRLVRDLFYAIEDLDISSEEVWHAIDWFTESGRDGMYGLIAAGLGLEHFLDERMIEAEKKAGMSGGTARTIEGPLFVEGAPESLSYAELEDVPEKGAERLYMQGRVLDQEGNPVENAVVQVWHCNMKGNYSFFDKSQPTYNLRRAIRTGKDGRYQFKSFLPVGYSCPPGSSIDRLLKELGRHGSRPAHIHFFVTAPSQRKLTTQINIAGDPLLGHDFAFADRVELVPKINRINSSDAKTKFGKDEAFASIDFDFKMYKEKAGVFEAENHRTRAHPNV